MICFASQHASSLWISRKTMDIDLKTLRYFIKVVDESSITGAAKQLSITQPGLSRLMRQFEEETGWALFERGSHSLKITRAGEIVAREGKVILKHAGLGWRRMKQEIDGGEIHIGFAPSLGRELLQRAMRSFAESHPRVRLHLADCDSQQMLKSVRDGSLDLILEIATNDSDLQWHSLQEREIRIAIPPSHRLSKRRKVKPADLHESRLLLLSRADYPSYWEQVTQYIANNKVNVRIAGEFDGAESLSLALKAGLGTALVVEGSAVGQDGIRIVKLDPAPPPICVAVGWLAKRRLEPWIEAFVTELKNVAKNSS